MVIFAALFIVIITILFGAFGQRIQEFLQENALGTLLSLLSGINGRLRGGTEAEEDVEPLTPSPSSPTTGGSEFEVFLSFRGEDTRKRFIGHLYDDLVERGVSTFIDSKKLEKGEEIGKLFEYIERSKIFLPIFSERYAESKWCLKEVTKSLECGQEIFPVFFGVEPSDVGNQRGPFKSAFRKHESNNQLNQEEVRKWREALKKVGKISGFNLKDMNGDEAKLKRAVIKRVLEKVNKKPLQVAKHPIGIETRVQDVKKKLENGGNNVNGVHVVGIHGMGGLGKTTIARAVYNDLAEGFNGPTCFLSNVRENAGQPDGLLKLQTKFFHEILKDGNIFLSDVAHAVSLIKERARGKRLLLILDDVDSRAQLDALAGGRDWFGSGSVIIITTRDEQVLLAYSLKQDEIYKPEVLNEQQSRELFLLHAFNGEEPEGEYLRLSNEVVAAAAGLPLTIEVLGSLLTRGMDVEQWQNTLDRLKRIPPTEVQQKLKLSYDRLHQTEQKIFLDISCFFIGRGRKYATYMWEDCQWFPKHAIKVLEQRSLLKIDRGSGEFEMHDQIRDMGRAIVEEECSGRPEKQSRPWISQDSLDLLRRKVPGTIDAEAIRIWPDGKGFESENYYCVSAGCFENMPNLRYLEASHLNFQGTSQCFPPSLKWLELDSCHFDPMPSDFSLEKAVVLKLQNTNMARVLINQLPLKAFEKLKVLSIEKAEINVIPDLTNVPCLVKLEVAFCPKLTTIDESIGKLKNLTDLSISNNEILGKIPDSIGEMSSLQKLDIRAASIVKIPDSICQLSSLEILDLEDCRSLTSLPERLGDVRSLEKLSLVDTSIIKMPDSIGHLTKLRELHIHWSERLLRLPDPICQLSSLEILNLESCGSLTSLPERLGDMRSLEKLNINSARIIKMPDSIGQLTNLRKLHMRNCGRLSRLPDSICQLSSLEILDLECCWSLTSLPERLGDMRSLEKLNIEHISIFMLPDSIGQLTNLRELHMGRCQRLSRLPDSLCQLSSLEILDLEGCGSLTSLPGRLGDMRSLEELRITLSSIIKMPDSIGQLTNLRELHMRWCKSLLRLPESICLLSSLEVLDLRWCRSLCSVPECIGDMESLKKLDLSETAIDVIPDTICQLSLLVFLNLGRCKNLCSLPEKLGDLDKLEELILDGTRTEVIPDSVGRLKNLRLLSLEGCKSIKALPDSIRTLSSLKELKMPITTFNFNHHLSHLVRTIRLTCSSSLLLSLCDQSRKALKHLHLNDAAIEELPHCVGEMGNLENLQLECDMLKGLPNWIERYSEKLTHLEVSSKHLKALPDCIGSLIQLQTLTLKCENLKALPDTVGSLKQMWKLELNCMNLEGLPDSIGGLTNISILQIESAKLKELPSSITLLTRVMNLKLKCPNLEKLPDSMGELESLKHFVVDSDGLICLPNSIGSLTRITTLELNCQNLEALPDSMEALQHLERLTLNCDQFSVPPDFIGRLKKLESFSFKSNNLKQLNAIIFGSLGRLTSLTLSGCENLEDLTGFAHLSSLESLHLIDCKRLECSPQLPFSLYSLDASGCTNLRTMSDVSDLKGLEDLNLGGCKMLEDVPGLENISGNLGWLELPGPCDFMGCCHLSQHFKNKVFMTKETTFVRLVKFAISGSVVGGSTTGKQQLHFMLPKLPFIRLRSGWLSLELDKVVPPIHVLIMADDTTVFEKTLEVIEGNIAELNLRKESFVNTGEEEKEHCYKIQVTADVSQLEKVRVVLAG